VNTARTMIEAYPLSGVLGTVLAIGSALQADAALQATSGVNLVMERFGDFHLVHIRRTALGRRPDVRQQFVGSAFCGVVRVAATSA